MQKKYMRVELEGLVALVAELAQARAKARDLETENRRLADLLYGRSDHSEARTYAEPELPAVCRGVDWTVR